MKWYCLVKWSLCEMFCELSIWLSVHSVSCKYSNINANTCFPVDCEILSVAVIHVAALKR